MQFMMAWLVGVLEILLPVQSNQNETRRGKRPDRNTTA
jgi:hypothetical protein